MIHPNQIGLIPMGEEPEPPELATSGFSLVDPERVDLVKFPNFAKVSIIIMPLYDDNNKFLCVCDRLSFSVCGWSLETVCLFRVRIFTKCAQCPYRYYHSL